MRAFYENKIGFYCLHKNKYINIKYKKYKNKDKNTQEKYNNEF